MTTPNRFNFRAWHQVLSGEYQMDHWSMTPGCLFEWPWEATKAIIMQSTGLADKNGKEIFEGDVIETSLGKATVCFGEWTCVGYEYNEKYYGYYVSWGFSEEGLDIEFARRIHVLGSIYENPEWVVKE